MNKKLIVAAVSAAVVAPVASQAADVTVYGNITNAIDIGGGTTDLSSIVSRLGVRASSDLGNGLSGHGVYEFGTTTDKKGSGINNARVATVGLSGGFGRIDLGNQWSAYFNTFGTLISPTYSLGGALYSAGPHGGVTRASNTIKYSNTFGPLHAELDVRLNDSDTGALADTSDDLEAINGEGVGLGLSFAATDDITIAAAFDTEDGGVGADDDDRLGVAVKGAFGGFWGSVGWQSFDPVDTLYFWGGGSIGEKTNLQLGYATASDVDRSQVTWGAFHKLGGGVTLFYEGAAPSDTVGDNRNLLGMRINF